MRLVTFALNQQPHLGLIHDGQVFDLTEVTGGLTCMKQLIADWAALGRETQRGDRRGNPLTACWPLRPG